MNGWSRKFKLPKSQSAEDGPLPTLTWTRRDKLKLAFSNTMTLNNSVHRLNLQPKVRMCLPVKYKISKLMPCLLLTEVGKQSVTVHWSSNRRYWKRLRGASSEASSCRLHDVYWKGLTESSAQRSAPAVWEVLVLPGAVGEDVFFALLCSYSRLRVAQYGMVTVAD